MKSSFSYIYLVINYNFDTWLSQVKYLSLSYLYKQLIVSFKIVLRVYSPRVDTWHLYQKEGLHIAENIERITVKINRNDIFVDHKHRVNFPFADNATPIFLDVAFKLTSLIRKGERGTETELIFWSDLTISRKWRVRNGEE